jgi:hypothetical protein
MRNLSIWVISSLGRKARKMQEQLTQQCPIRPKLINIDDFESSATRAIEDLVTT